jgi:hypothetical protein
MRSPNCPGFKLLTFNRLQASLKTASWKGNYRKRVGKDLRRGMHYLHTSKGTDAKIDIAAMNSRRCGLRAPVVFLDIGGDGHVRVDWPFWATHLSKPSND